MKVLVSSADDIYANLGLEEALLDEGAGAWLLFTCNADAVVLGRNQNPWREVRMAALAESGLRLARRISGGGTVYHDRGNLNYSLVLPRGDYQRDRVIASLQAGLQRCGIAAEPSGAHSLVAAGRKFSGTAFCYRRSRVLHHGTLLVRADLGRLASVLGCSLPGIETRATPSVPAAVVNLAELVPHLTFSQLQSALADALAAQLGELCEQVELDEGLAARAAERAERIRSAAWTLEETPVWTLAVPTPGGRTGQLVVERGRFVQVDPDVPAGPRVVGVFCRRADLRSALAGCPPADAGWWEPILDALGEGA